MKYASYDKGCNVPQDCYEETKTCADLDYLDSQDSPVIKDFRELENEMRVLDDTINALRTRLSLVLIEDPTEKVCGRPDGPVPHVPRSKVQAIIEERKEHVELMATKVARIIDRLSI